MRASDLVNEPRPIPDSAHDTSDASEEGPLVPLRRKPPTEERVDLEEGLMYAHRKLGDAMLERAELEAHVYALTEALIASGVLGLQELEQRKRVRSEQVMQRVHTEWQGAQLLGDTRDKYEVEPVRIDCASRIHLCKAACCRLTFQLSRQDLEEHVVRWDVSRPYSIKQRDDGWCTHCDPATKRCQVHEQRPMVCRGYDCRQDARIWADFDEKVPNPDLARL